ncbi:hypothetical protein GMLC_21520 [Geomonas limicola]|uniref:Uncharacterized protein n=1 Tax=Geomonas limicola TaxID=2740186 RepID=A0A6V8NAK0_9BACT|nr:hypothetical protein [Geomonas limicola]GFO68573.1 hypothetical protein GMLC_21520 [Geomonas limicola]
MTLYAVTFSTSRRTRTITTRASSPDIAEAMVTAWLKLQGLQPLTVAAKQ